MGGARQLLPHHILTENETASSEHSRQDVSEQSVDESDVGHRPCFDFGEGVESFVQVIVLSGGHFYPFVADG